MGMSLENKAGLMTGMGTAVALVDVREEQVAGLYAQRLAEQGYLTITADAAYQGASGGLPRSVDKPARRHHNNCVQSWPR